MMDHLEHLLTIFSKNWDYHKLFFHCHAFMCEHYIRVGVSCYIRDTALHVTEPESPSDGDLLQWHSWG